MKHTYSHENASSPFSPPPQLPPQPDSNTMETPPPPYTPYAQGTLESQDPRSSSTQSLLPEETPDRRRLLLVYIHGFQGDETSFQSFPAHIHNLVKITLADTYTIHTKIYPKYRTRRSMEFACDDFSNWLSPHESENTDVILLGHSMGGLLSAEVVLLRPANAYSRRVFRHRILGTINLDVPFLGMHPGVISSGLGSIFRPADKSEPSASASRNDQHGSPQRQSTLFQKPTDPYYNPAFANDVNLPIRKGWANTMHFLNKHKKSIIKSSRDLVTSHLQYGGAMADYSSLKKRYNTIRPLEEENEVKRKAATNGNIIPPRVRFVNYYTASTGRPKKSRTPSPDSNARGRSRSPGAGHLAPTTSHDSGAPAARSRSRSPRTPTDIHDTGVEGSVQNEPSHEHSTPVDSNLGQLSISDEVNAQIAQLPPLPSKPDEPLPFDPSRFTNADVLKYAQKTHDREVERYKQQLDAWETAMDERAALEETLRGQGSSKSKDSEPSVEASKTALQRVSEAQSEYSLATVEDLSHQSGIDGDSSSQIAGSHAELRTTESARDKKKKPKRDRKFCMLPAKDGHGVLDPAWVRVYMEGVDEVGAHCGLFFLSETYEHLVGDVSSRIEEWVREDLTRRYLESVAME